MFTANSFPSNSVTAVWRFWSAFDAIRNIAEEGMFFVSFRYLTMSVASWNDDRSVMEYSTNMISREAQVSIFSKQF